MPADRARNGRPMRSGGRAPTSPAAAGRQGGRRAGRYACPQYRRRRRRGRRSRAGAWRRARTERHRAGGTARGLVLHPAQLVPIPVCVLFVVGRQLRLRRRRAALAAARRARRRAGRDARRRAACPARHRPRHAVRSSRSRSRSITLVIYMIGWGATLAVGFVFNVADHLDAATGRAPARPAIVVQRARRSRSASARSRSAGCQTLLPEPQGHGLAVLEAAGVCCVIWMHRRSRSARRRRSRPILRRSEERLARSCSTRPTRSS